MSFFDAVFTREQLLKLRNFGTDHVFTKYGDNMQYFGDEVKKSKKYRFLRSFRSISADTYIKMKNWIDILKERKKLKEYALH